MVDIGYVGMAEAAVTGRQPSVSLETLPLARNARDRKSPPHFGHHFPLPANVGDEARAAADGLVDVFRNPAPPARPAALAPADRGKESKPRMPARKVFELVPEVKVIGPARTLHEHGIGIRVGG